MEARGVELCSSSGLLHDGWCEPRIMLNLKTDPEASELRLGLWAKGKGSHPSVVALKVSCEDERPVARTLRIGAEDIVSVPIRPSSRGHFSLHIQCNHLLDQDGGDVRMLSFLLLSLTAA